jgi:hypothetical protein
MNDDDKYLRDLFAGFAMNGLLGEIKSIYEPQQMEKLTNLSYEVADAMMEARDKEESYAEKGITAIKKRTATRKMD